MAGRVPGKTAEKRAQAQRQRQPETPQRRPRWDLLHIARWEPPGPTGRQGFRRNRSQGPGWGLPHGPTQNSKDQGTRDQAQWGDGRSAAVSTFHSQEARCGEHLWSLTPWGPLHGLLCPKTLGED